jgi:ribose 5-phosphate isomerase B
MKKIALGTDHAGFTLKEVIKDYLEAKGYEIIDYGTHGDEPVDYPDYIRPAAQSVADGENELGIVFGGSGNGEAMVAI